MELGEKLRQARMEAGLSQRQLCGGVITRNMLSQIEHGTARPSMDTLRHLAGQLGKPLSFFLEEEAVLSPNQGLMHSARTKYKSGRMKEAWLLLQGFRHPDPVLEWEWQYLSAVAAMALAEQALAEEKHLYARQLLEEMEPVPMVGLERQRLMLLGRIPGADLPELVRRLPGLDEELLLRAEAALAEEAPEKAEGLLLAVQDRNTPRWNLLRGRALVRMQRYQEGAACLERAETEFPEICWPLLEICFREQGDFRRAYFYACKQK